MLASMVGDLKRVEKRGSVPDGEYEGTWSGYVTTFRHGTHFYKVDTAIGVRGLRVPCVVVVSLGDIYVRAADV